MSELTRTEQHVVRQALAPWQLIRGVGWSFKHERDWAVYSVASCSYTLDGVNGWCQITRAGIGWSPNITHSSSKPSEYEVFVTWSRLEDHLTPFIKSAARKQRFSEHAKASLEVQLASPTFAPPKGGDAEKYRTEVWEPASTAHLVQVRELRAAERILVEEVLPLTADDEPSDLLEMLAADH